MRYGLECIGESVLVEPTSVWQNCPVSPVYFRLYEEGNIQNVSLTRLALLAVVSLGAVACADVSGLSAYSTNCSGACADASVGPMGSDDGSAESAANDAFEMPGADAGDAGGSEDSAETSEAGVSDTDAPVDANGGGADASDSSGGGCDGAACTGTISSPTAWACSKGGCNALGGTCSSSGACYCTADTQCNSGKCVNVAGQNDVSCGSNCTGSGATDGFACQLVSPGIPASCAAAFAYTPSNFSPASYTAPPGATTIDCGTTYSSSTHSFASWCTGQTQPTIVSGVSQTNGPNVDVLVFSGLTIPAGGTLTLTGGNAIILAVYGNAVISGAIHADGAAGASSTSNAGASGPGGNYSCGAHAGQSSGDNNDDSGGGGGASANGGAGANGVFGAAGAAGTSRANAAITPLYGGCPGGSSGSWACTTSGGGGGGAVQISAAGTLTVTGTISASGGAGGTSACHMTQSLCGNDYPGGGGGGGSGGAILLEGQSVTTSGGTVTVSGGAGGNPQAGSGVGGKGGTSASPTGQDGTGSAGACGSVSQAAGGGGGGYGYLRVNGGQQGPTYSCVTTLSPPPVCSAAHNACLCASDSDCASGKCVAAAQCKGTTCTGAGSPDVAGCQVPMAGPTGFGCAKGNCSSVTSSAGTCGAAGVPCWCASDADCNNTQCVIWAGCSAGACTGTGAPDAFHCVF
jgi:hypothetical protein